MGSDSAGAGASSTGLDFNPRSPCGERRVSKAAIFSMANFNPRSPCGERHHKDSHPNYRPEFQSTLPVWGATSLLSHCLMADSISIHAPRVGSDLYPVYKEVGYDISIHAPRVGSDLPVLLSVSVWCNFNPRSPCGERRISRRIPQSSSVFQSTPPVWGATFDTICSIISTSYFNPRSPCGERLRQDPDGSECCYFNPRSPCGERLV